MKTKTFLKILLVSLLIILLLWFQRDGRFVNSILMSKNEENFYTKFSEFVASGKSKILLKELTNFEWNRVCLVEPYGGIVDESLRNFKLDQELPSDDESKYSLVFFQTDEGVGVVLNLNRNASDIIEIGPNQRLCKDIENSFLEKSGGKVFFN